MSTGTVDGTHITVLYIWLIRSTVGTPRFMHLELQKEGLFHRRKAHTFMRIAKREMAPKVIRWWRKWKQW